uniref:Oleosin2 n=1 Tax=Plukenetia volubilis TaxID=316893 RepID=J9S4Z6_9ROSI|nr:oleosin2 [Plukenetia volubilis]
MADRLTQQHPFREKRPEGGPSTSQILAVVTLLPLSGTLLFLAGVTLTGTLIGLAVTTPLFVICSPVIVPAALVIALAVFGFLASGAFGITALSSLSWMLNYFKRMRGSLPMQMDQAKRRMQETTGQFGQKARETGQAIQSKAQEATK